MEQQNRAPIVRLSIIAPSLASIPETVHETALNNNHLLAVPKPRAPPPPPAAKPTIPDGGWGWMVVLSCLFLSLIMDGISFSFGILFVEFLAEFQESISATSWIGSLFISVPLLTGPVMSALVDKYGCRRMTIVGGLVSAGGFVLSSMAPNIGVMYVTFGIVSGLGLGLTFITAVVSIAFWFEKKRNLAVGLGACGIGIGTFVYAPFTAYLLREFGWRWTVVLLAGTLLNMCVCGALMRDPDWIIDQNKRNNSHKIKSSRSNSSFSSTTPPSSTGNEEGLKNSNIDVSGDVLAPLNQSLLNLPTFINQNETQMSSHAPILTLDGIAPPLDSDLTAIDMSESDDGSDTLTVPLEVRFRDSIMSSRADSEENEAARSKPTIPDGGWGWMVVFSSLMLSLIQDGISFSFGILFIEFVNEFQASVSTTSWIGSLFLSVPLMTGPVMSALVDKYGCRKMTILGGLISATGFILSSMARSIGVMYITFGIISGLGLGLTYITAVVSIAFWFEKKRNLAVGLGACGTGIGTFVYAPFTTFLLYEFGWRWTVVLLAGTLLNICVCGALMRDPDWIQEQNKKNSSKLSHKSSKSSKTSSISNVSLNEKLNLDELRGLLKSGKNTEYILQTLATSVNTETNSQGVVRLDRNQSVVNLPTFIRQDETVPVEVLEQLSENKRLYKIILENYPSLLLTRSTSDRGLNRLPPDSPVARIPVTVSLKLKRPPKPKTLIHQQSLPEHPAALEPLLPPAPTTAPVVVANSKHYVRTNSAPWLVKQFTATNPNQNYFKNMRFPRHSLIHRGAVLNKNKYRLRASSCPNIYRVSMTTLLKEEDGTWYGDLWESCQELFDFSLFLEFHFFLMSLSTIILFAWFMTPYFYLADHMDIIGYTKTEASFVMSAIGITNTIGMVALGWAGDQDWCNVPKTYALCLVLCGIFCCGIMFFSSNYILLTISAALYGITLASSFSFTPVILVELLPLETFTKAYGLTLLCQGIGHLGGPPVAGLLKDYTGNWDSAFYLSGVWIILSGILIIIIPFTRNRKMFGSGPVEKELANEKA